MTSRGLSRALHPAFSRRQEYDYGEMIPLTRKTAEETLRDATTLVAAIETHLRAGGHLAGAQP